MIRIREAGIGWVLALVQPTASARESVDVALEFNAPIGCSDRETFAAGLRSRSDLIRIAEPSDRGWIVSVRLTPKDRGVHGELRLTDASGASELRAVDGADCAEVVEALSLTAALAIEQIAAQAAEASSGASNVSGPAGAAASGTAGSPSELAPSKTSAAPLPTQNSNTSDAPEADASGAWSSDANAIGLQGLISQRVSPQTSLGLALTLSHRFALADLWSPELSIAALYFPSGQLQLDSAIGVRYIAMALQGCPIAWSMMNDVIALRPCAVYELGRLTVTDRSVDVSYPSKRLTSYAGVTGLGRVRVGRHQELELQLALLAPLAQRRYWANAPSTEVAHTTTLTYQVGIGWRFGW